MKNIWTCLLLGMFGFSSIASAELMTAAELNQQVMKLYREKRYNEALKVGHMALSAANDETSMTGLQRNRLTALTNLGIIHYAQGKYAQAEPYFLDAYQLVKEYFEEGDGQIGEIPDYLAVTLREIGKYEEAVKYAEEAVESAEKEAARNPHRVYVAYTNLGLVYLYQDHFEEAEEALLKALETAQNIFGNTGSDVATAWHNMAMLYTHQEKCQEARQPYIKSIELKEEELGKEDVSLAPSYLGLGACERMLENFEEAEANLDKAVSLWKKAFGPENPYLGRTSLEYAQLYQMQNQYDLAETFYEKAKDLFRDYQPSLARELEFIRDNLEKVRIFRDQEASKAA